MNPDNSTVIKTLPWWDDTLVITSAGTGLAGLHACYLNETYPLPDFLNHCLAIEHAELRDKIITAYETKLGVEDIFALNPPTIPDNLQTIDPAAIQPAADDAALVEALLTEYDKHLKSLKDYFSKSETIFGTWYKNQIKK